MKHTFWYIDNLMELIADIPPQIKSQSDISKMEKLIDRISEYDYKLGKLIDAHRTTEHLQKLHASHIDSIPDWIERVNAQFRKLDELMKVLYEDIPKLKAILEEIRKVGIPTINEKIRVEEQTRVDNREKGIIYYKEACNKWASKVADMSMGIIMSGFHHAEHNMEEFRKVAIFEKKHLLEIIEDLDEVNELLE